VYVAERYASKEILSETKREILDSIFATSPVASSIRDETKKGPENSGPVKLELASHTAESGRA
jgi:hypothetical protein